VASATIASIIVICRFQTLNILISVISPWMQAILSGSKSAIFIRAEKS